MPAWCKVSSPRIPVINLSMTHGKLTVASSTVVPHTSPQGGMSSALMVADVHVFRHEFITQFRYSHRATVHPADMHRVNDELDKTRELTKVLRY